MAAPPPTFWGAVVTPSAPLPVKYPIDCLLTMTNACIAEPSAGAVRLILNVETLASSGDELRTEKTRSLIASFIPDRAEHARMDIVLSDQSKATLEVQGTVPVHISGIVTPLDFSDIDIDGEEEEEENPAA
jgi:hypothetical protein